MHQTDQRQRADLLSKKLSFKFLKPFLSKFFALAQYPNFQWFGIEKCAR